MSTRPCRNAPAPRPAANSFYCRTCGRIIYGCLFRSNTAQAPRKSHTTQPTPQKYCSDRCRREKPRPGATTEANIEMAFVRLLGDVRERRIVKCEEVERVVFPMTGRRAEEADGGIGSLDAAEQGKEGQNSYGDEPEDEDGGVKLPCQMNHPTATTTPPLRPKMEEVTPGTRQEWGMQKAKEREMVRRAARRGVAFGFEIERGRRRGVEAVQGARVVESSFAKGEWGVRWREQGVGI